MEAYYKFLKLYSKRRYSRGEVILQQDDIPRTAYIVRGGIIKTYNLTINGEEKPIAFKLKDDAFPASWLFLKSQRALYYYEALTDCELYLIPAHDYIKFLKSNPEVLFEIFQNLVDDNIAFQMRINALEQSKAKDKVLNTLQFLVHRFGKDINRSLVEIQLPFTQQDMANFMGLARETAAIELKKLEREGVISYHHRSYIIQTHLLKELLGEDYDNSYEFAPFTPPKVTVTLVDRFKNAYGKTYK